MTNTLNKIVAYIVHTMEPEEILLFGSFAEGRNNVHSDIDLLIIAENVHSKIHFSNQIKSFTHELGLPSDVLIYSKVEIEKAKKETMTFLAQITKTGKIIYKKS